MFVNQNRSCSGFDGRDFFGALSVATDAVAPHQQKSHQCKATRELTKARKATVKTAPDADALAEPVAFERDIRWEELREVSDQAGGKDARIEQ